MEKNDRKTVSAVAADCSGKHKKTGGEKVKIDEKKLLIALARRGWNLVNLASELGVSRVTAYGYKKRNIRPSTLYRLAKALNCEPEELLE